MDRRLFLRTGALGAGGAILAAPALAQTKAEVTWRLTSSFPQSLDTIYGAGETLASYIEQR